MLNITMWLQWILLKCSRAIDYTSYYVECVCLTFVCVVFSKNLNVWTSVGRTWLLHNHLWCGSEEVIYGMIDIVSFMQVIKHWIWEHCNIILYIWRRPRYYIFVSSVGKSRVFIDLVVNIHIRLVHLVTRDNAIRCLFSPKSMREKGAYDMTSF